jgi:hypothetical protein
MNLEPEKREGGNDRNGAEQPKNSLQRGSSLGNRLAHGPSSVSGE